MSASGAMNAAVLKYLSGSLENNCPVKLGFKDGQTGLRGLTVSDIGDQRSLTRSNRASSGAGHNLCA